MVSLSVLRELEQANRGRRCADHPDVRLAAIASDGQAFVYCGKCRGSPRHFVENESVTTRYRRGRAVPAAVAGHIERKLGVTTESKALVQQVRASAPSRLPGDTEVKEIMSAFHGWEKGEGGRELVPARPTAIILWKLIQMGFAPQDINIIGGKPYINVDGRIAHAYRLLEARGRTFGVDWTMRHAEVTDPAERRLAGARDSDVCIKVVYCVRSTVRRILPDGTKEESDQWLETYVEYGRGNGTDTVVKTPKGNNQPIELRFPARMAWIRGTQHLLKVVAPVTMPGGVGYMVEGEPVEAGVIEGQGRVVDAPAGVLPGTAASLAPETESAEAGADTPAEAAPEPQEPSASQSPETPAAPERPTLKPTLDPVPLADVKRNGPLKAGIKNALGEAGVAPQQVTDFAYNLQLGVEAVLQLAADGYRTEQIVQIVKGEAVASLGWD